MISSRRKIFSFHDFSFSFSFLDMFYCQAYLRGPFLSLVRVQKPSQQHKQSICRHELEECCNNLLFSPPPLLRFNGVTSSNLELLPRSRWICFRFGQPKEFQRWRKRCSRSFAEFDGTKPFQATSAHEICLKASLSLFRWCPCTFISLSSRLTKLILLSASFRSVGR